MTKAELRKTIRIRLAALSAETQAEKSAAICRAISRTPQWQSARTVGFFSPLSTEPNVDLLWAVLGERTVCYPRLMEKDEMVFLSVPNREALLESSRWNLLEPPHRDEHVVSPADLDLLLVPGVAFTPDGHRMGRGKGCYDRFLAQCRAVTFGVCFAEQVIPRLPMEDHDRPVNEVFAF